MKSILIVFATLSLLISSAAFAECSLPSSPIIPDGNVASEDELLAAKTAISDYQGQLGEYRVCLQGMQAELDPEAEASAAKITELNGMYDASVDAETAVADEFNNAVRAFKSRQ